MIKQIRSLIFILVPLLLLDLYAQNRPEIRRLSYEALDEIIEKHKGQPEVFLYLEAFLEKAKKEENLDEVIYGYQNYIYEVEYGQKLVYADSMIYAAKLTKNNDKIGSALLTKGIVYYNGRDHNRALDSYLAANLLIATGDDEYLKYKIQYHIAQEKYYLGFYNEAVSLFLKCADYFKEENSRAYLTCLQSLAQCYTRLGNFQESDEKIEYAFKESARLKDFSIISYLHQAEGVNDYNRKLYNNAVSKLKKSLGDFKKVKDFGNLSVSYFYIASSYWDMGKKNLAFPYLLKVDKIFTDKKYIRPDLRKNYEMLIDHYKGKGDRELELFYTNKLLQADKILHTNYKYLSSRINKEYDTAKLITNYKDIKHDLRVERGMRIALLVVSILMVPLAAYLGYRNVQLRRYKKNFEQYKKNSTIPPIQTASRMHRPNISDDLEQELLKKLGRFEAAFGYLKKDLKIEKLAANFGTNYKYLSQVVNYHKGMSYPDYISNLRINYIVKKLEEDSKLRNYNFGAIAEEAGFGTAQQFTDVFKKKMGMPFAYFLRNLE
ncbi:AraC family transcriptional regulator [Flavobacterium humidisoli]|uniref:Helix-turn-helix domain-containing protein n=1 Tax=Flavobacterium humidisoli TaxID=2937442 RepID=A0ABY4M0F2_9FLAO|nr:AraC family transcriptional regulator [Flavobacterium humidisoli]UPZ17939.1 helix-turn-helix domain-containing protein [Flavobacterium humidisoli]